MALQDLLNRCERVEVGGRRFSVRPISLQGWLEIEGLLGQLVGAVNEKQSEAFAERMKGLEQAALFEDETKAAAAIGDMYLEVIDSLGTDALALVLSKVCEPADPVVIAGALTCDPAGKRSLLLAVAAVHDFERLLRLMVPPAAAASDGASEEEASGPRFTMETAILSICAWLPAYKVEDILAWPFERFLTVNEQRQNVLELQARAQGRFMESDEWEEPEIAPAGSLGGRGYAPPRETVN